MVCPLWVAKAIPIPVAQEEAASSGFGPDPLFAAVRKDACNGRRSGRSTERGLHHRA
jgi:hypothetical protein